MSTPLIILLSLYFVPIVVWIILIRYFHKSIEAADFGAILQPTKSGLLIAVVFCPAFNLIMVAAVVLGCIIEGILASYEKLGGEDLVQQIGGFIRSLMKNKE